LHLVDLNGAFAGEPVNGEIVTAIAHEFPEIPVQIGGGIRDFDTIEYYLKVGVEYVILGTKALKDPVFVKDACRQFGGHIIVGIDAIDGCVATEGWAEVSTVQAIELAVKFKNAGVSAIVYTDIGRDGMMQGANSEATAHLARSSGLPVIASGGVSDMEDIRKLKAVAESGIIGAITGRAIYEGTLDVAEAQAFCDE
jgi:phosphoribosylformimino-5-aminoimidazole carboxamide ribotide isomerase